MTNKMNVQFLTADNKPAKLFREDFYATGDMVAMAIRRLLEEGVKKDEITTKKVKVKMHDMLYNHGMGAFVDNPTPQARVICKEMFPEFYQEMKEVVKPPVTKKEEKAASKPKPEASKKETKQPAPTANKSAIAPEFRQPSA